jgi:hypothetical protein
MTTFTKQKLSEDSTGEGFSLLDGVPVLVHTTQASSNVLDEVWIYVVNNSFSNNGILQVAWQEKPMFIEVPALSGTFLAIPGLVISGDGTNTSSVSVADMTGEFEESLSVHGFINRITS